MKSHDGCIRGYHRSSKEWYAKTVMGDRTDIHFGMYRPDGGTTGEMSVKWTSLGLGPNRVPELDCFDDAWSALSLFGDLLQKMGERDGENITEEEFSKMLDSCGFKDLTKYEGL